MIVLGAMSLCHWYRERVVCEERLRAGGKVVGFQRCTFPRGERQKLLRKFWWSVGVDEGREPLGP